MNDTPLLDDEKNDEDNNARRMDPELKVMSLLLRELRALDRDAQVRVVAYVCSRFKE